MTIEIEMVFNIAIAGAHGCILRNTFIKEEAGGRPFIHNNHQHKFSFFKWRFTLNVPQTDTSSPEAFISRVFCLQFCEFMSLCCLMHLSGAVIRILLDYVSHVHICSKLRLILEKQREWTEICQILSEFVSHLYNTEAILGLKRMNNDYFSDCRPFL